MYDRVEFETAHVHCMHHQVRKCPKTGCARKTLSWGLSSSRDLLLTPRLQNIIVHFTSRMACRIPALPTRCVRSRLMRLTVVALCGASVIMSGIATANNVHSDDSVPSRQGRSSMPSDPPNSYKGYTEAGPWPMPRSLTRRGNTTAQFSSGFKFVCDDGHGCDATACT